MTLIKCPECKKKISDNAENCPNCGYTLSKYEKIKLIKEEKDAKKYGGIGCIVIIIIFLIIWFQPWSNKKSNDKITDIDKQETEITKKTSIAYKLAVVEKDGYVSENDQTVKRFDYLLTRLDNKYVDNKQEIADKTVKAKQLLEDRGVKESMIKMMEGMNSLNDPKDSYKNYSEYMTIYIVLRSNLQNHDETIKKMQGAINLVGIEGLMKTAGFK